MSDTPISNGNLVLSKWTKGKCKNSYTPSSAPTRGGEEHGVSWQPNPLQLSLSATGLGLVLCPGPNGWALKHAPGDLLCAAGQSPLPACLRKDEWTDRHGPAHGSSPEGPHCPRALTPRFLPYLSQFRSQEWESRMHMQYLRSANPSG